MTSVSIRCSLEGGHIPLVKSGLPRTLTRARRTRKGGLALEVVGSRGSPGPAGADEEPLSAAHVGERKSEIRTRRGHTEFKCPKDVLYSFYEPFTRARS